MIFPSSIPIIRNKLLIDQEQNTICRVIYVDPDSNHTWLCRTDDDSWPYPIRTDVLRDELNSESGRFIPECEDPAKRAIAAAIHADDDRLSCADKRHIARWDLIAPLVEGDNEQALLCKATRSKLIASRLREVKTSRQTISSLLRLYWKRGMCFAAVQTNYANCGAPGQRRTCVSRKLGRPRILRPGVGIIVTDDVRQRFAAAANYLFRKKCTLEHAYDWLVEYYFARIRRDDQGTESIEIDEDSKPSLAQFRYFLETEHSRVELRRKRVGEKRWMLHLRALGGKADNDIQGPGDRFHIDATVADVYLRSQFDRRRITGRPVIYFVVDCYSRMIVGLYVGYEGPSWVGAMMALVNVVTPKVEWCRQYGVRITDFDWPAHYLPKIIQADCGELKGTRVGQSIVRNLRIDIVNIASGRPDMQAIVEHLFGTVPAKFKEFTPGYVEPDFGERGARDYRLDSKFTLPEFTSVVLRAAILHNYTPIKDKSIHPEMITNGMTPCPLDLWEWGIQNRSGSLRHATVDEVALNVMIPGNARVTPNGIRFKGEHYSCSTALKMEWFEIARRHEWSVDISYDPRDLGMFYLHGLDLPSGYEVCSPIGANSDRSGKSQFELEELEMARKINIAATENDRQARRIRMKREMREVERLATAATSAVEDPKAPKSQKLAAIRDNRLMEKAFQREKEKFVLQPNTAERVEQEAQSSAASHEEQFLTNSSPLTHLRQLRTQREADDND
jgi:transposase InsO family protein